MIKSSQNNPLLKLLVGLVITATLQFFVPLLNAAVSDECCESHLMQCCEEEIPSPTVCCSLGPNEPLDDSAPTQGLTTSIQKTPKTIILNSFNAPGLPLLFAKTLATSPILDFVSTDNHLYKKSSAFLI